MIQLWGLVLLPLVAFLFCLLPFRRVIVESRAELLLLALLVLAFLWRLVLHGEMIVQKDANLLQIPYLQSYQLSFLHHQIPLWNPALWLGIPALAHPLFHACHPITPLALLLPVHAAFNAGLTLMLFLCCAGMLFFARELGLGRGAALVAAVVYGFNEFTLDRLGAPTGPGVEYLYSYAFVPLSLALMLRAARDSKLVERARFGLSLVFVLNGNPNLACYAFAILLVALMGLSRMNPLGAGLRSAVVTLAVGCLVMLAGDAVELIPLYEFGSQAGGGRLVEEAAGWRVQGIDWTQLGSLFLPHLPRAHFGYSGRVGWVALALALVALVPRRSRNGRVVVVMAIVLAAGVLLVTHALPFTSMPGLPSIVRRVSLIPSVFLLFVLPLSLLAGMGAERSAPRGAVLPALLALLAFVEVLGASRGWNPALRFTPLATYDPAGEVDDFPHLDAVADPSGRSLHRIDCRTPHHAMICPDYAVAARGLRLVRGDRYQFPGAGAARLAAAGGAARSLLDVRYVLSPDPLDDPALSLRATVAWEGQTRHREMALREATRSFNEGRERPWDQQVFIYEAPALPHAFLAPRPFVLEALPPGPAAWEITVFSPVRIELTGLAREPGMLVVSEVASRGWKATVDGRDAGVERVAGGLIGVELSAGAREVKLRYDPASFRVGFWVSAATLVAVIALAARRRPSRSPT